MGFEEVFEVASNLLELQGEVSKHLQGVAEAAEATRTARRLRLAMLRAHQDAARLHAEQEREIAELEFALATLIQIARASGAVDLEAYQHHVQQALAASNAARMSQTPKDLVQCRYCGAFVPRSKTVITEYGVVCDQCHNAST